MKIKITACQFRVEKVSNFNEFQKQVEDLITQVPENSDYIIFPELLTIGLSAAFGEQDASAVIRIDEYTNQYKDLFRSLSRKRSRSSLRARIWNAAKMNTSISHTFLIKMDRSLSIKKLISFLLNRIGILLKVMI